MLVNTDPIPLGPYADVVVLIDVLRTGTVASVLFDGKLASLTLSPTIKRARAEAATGSLLVGEHRGIPLEGFNHGNSPLELARVDVAGKDAVLVSENAPNSMTAVDGAKHVLLGSLFNAAAVARVAESLASERIDLVCCGFRGASDLDDLLAAGVIAASLGPGYQASGATNLALSLLRSYPDPLEALWQSTAGGYLRSLGQEQDLAHCAAVSVSSSVPRLASVSGESGAPLYRFTAV